MHAAPRFAIHLRTLGLAYAVAAFVGTWMFFAWLVIFLGNLPKRSEPWLNPSADVGSSAATESVLLAALANFALVTLFCLQHSLMARPSFKRLMARVVPPALERATYVHAANLAGFLMLLLWTPIPQPIWTIENDAVKAMIWIAFGTGWLILFIAALSIDVLELLGLRQAWAWYLGRTHAPLALKTTWLYRHFEHPMYVGVLLGFWMTPHMSVGHMLLAVQFTFYIAVAMSYERRDLQTRFGDAYLKWRAEPTRAVRSAPREAIARELRARFEQLVAEPLPGRMVTLLARIEPARGT